ncbi:MAG: type I restriction enzyme HsdR N-terminal domain-containing protein [Chloroflexi bacterium]|nr:type I restriction enzyme HsdR N-terminal domain-containing protein [Chloroflexota bacterium]
MDLKTSLNAIRDRIVIERQNDPDERNTMRTIVIPLIQTLGYDTASTNEVENEYPVSGGRAKADLVIKSDGKPVILVECKRIREELDGKKAGQLYDYFGRVPSAHIGVLTNGAQYLFFGNLPGAVNQMNMIPFASVDLEDDVDDREVEIMSLFSKTEFDAQRIMERCREETVNTQYRDKIVEYLFSQVHQDRMDDDFARLLARQGDPERRQWRDAALQEFEEHIKAAFAEFADRLVEERLEGQHVTAEEVEGHQLIRYILRDKIDGANIFRNEGKTYCTIQMDESTKSRKRLCRLHFKNPNAKKMELSDRELVDIDAIYDIMRYEDRIRAIADKYLTEG